MRPVGLVLDTAALVACANRDHRVGEHLAAVADRGMTVLIPAACLAAAYRDSADGGWDLLDLIGTLDHAVVSPLERGHCAVLGGWARTLGLDTAQAAIEAVTHGVAPLMTGQRDAVTRFLPKEWPIVDV